MQRSAGNAAVVAMLQGVESAAEPSALQRHVASRPFQRFAGERQPAAPTALRAASVARWTMPFVTSKNNEQLIKDGADGDVPAIKEISDFGPASADQKLRMVDHLLDQVLVGPRDEGALARIWLSFGDEFTEVASANLGRWKKSTVRYTGLSDRIPAVKTMRTDFVRDIEAVARQNLKENGKFADDQMAALGIQQDQSAAAAPLSVDQGAQLERMKDVGDTVASLQWAQQAALKVTVGFYEVLLPGDAKHWRKAVFDPTQPPPATTIPLTTDTSTYLYDDFTETERRVEDPSGIPEIKSYSEVKTKYDDASARVGKWLTEYPALLALTRENDPAATAGFAQQATPEQARERLGVALRGLRKDIEVTEGKLGGALNPLDLRPIHTRLEAKDAKADSGTDWAQELPKAVAADLLRDHSIDKALLALGLQLVAQISFVLAPVTGGASLVFLAMGTAALGAKAAMSQSQYDALARAAKASPVHGTSLVEADDVEQAKLLADSDAVAFGLALAVLGASLAAAGLKAIRGRGRPPVPDAPAANTPPSAPEAKPAANAPPAPENKPPGFPPPGQTPPQTAPPVPETQPPGATPAPPAATPTSPAGPAATAEPAPPEGAQLYRVGEGVRRSVAAREIGNPDVTGQVVGSGKPATKIPLDQLYVEPHKSQIARDQRFIDVLNGVGKGQTPPIEVVPITPERAKSLVPVGSVKLVRAR
jgi:hypothetical protein